MATEVPTPRLATDGPPTVDPARDNPGEPDVQLIEAFERLMLLAGLSL